MVVGQDWSGHQQPTWQAYFLPVTLLPRFSTPLPVDSSARPAPSFVASAPFLTVDPVALAAFSVPSLVASAPFFTVDPVALAPFSPPSTVASAPFLTALPVFLAVSPVA